MERLNNLSADFQAGAALRARNPLVHCITSPIAINDCANAVLAIGARPIMAEHPREAAGITAIAQSLGVSLANITDARAESVMISGKHAAASGIPSVIDVVGVNCSPLRMELAGSYLETCRPAVIKGNASEIRALAGAAYGEAGIDTAASDQVSRDNPGSVEQMAEIVRKFAAQQQAVVLASGIIDVISDGTSVLLVENGSPLMAKVTGTGCILNCLIAAYLAVADPLEAALFATALLGIAGEVAAEWCLTKADRAAAELCMTGIGEAAPELRLNRAGEDLAEISPGNAEEIAGSQFMAEATTGSQFMAEAAAGSQLMAESTALDAASHKAKRLPGLGSYHVALLDALSLLDDKQIKKRLKAGIL